MSIIVYSYNEDKDRYDEVATWHDDGTIDGNTGLAGTWRQARDDMVDQGYDLEEWYGQVEGVIDARYNNGYYRAVIQ